MPSSPRTRRSGAFVSFAGGGVMLPTRGDGLLTTAQAARLVGVSPKTISAWRSRPVDRERPDGPVFLVPDGLDERGYPLHSAAAVREAERLVRERGISLGGCDPRRLRRARTSRSALPAVRPQLRLG